LKVLNGLLYFDSQSLTLYIYLNPKQTMHISKMMLAEVQGL